jgi:hypothetical protein
MVTITLAKIGFFVEGLEFQNCLTGEQNEVRRFYPKISNQAIEGNQQSRCSKN